MVQVNWTRSAIADLLNVYAHIANDSVRYAQEVAERIRLATLPLKDHPKLGKPVPETDNTDIRELVVDRYRVIYWLMTPQHCEVIAVHHAKRQLPAQMLRRRLRRPGQSH